MQPQVFCFSYGKRLTARTSSRHWISTGAVPSAWWIGSSSARTGCPSWWQPEEAAHSLCSHVGFNATLHAALLTAALSSWHTLPPCPDCDSFSGRDDFPFLRPLSCFWHLTGCVTMKKKTCKSVSKNWCLWIQKAQLEFLLCLDYFNLAQNRWLK